MLNGIPTTTLYMLLRFVDSFIIRCINELLVSISSSDLGDCKGSEGRSGVSQQQPSIVSEASVGTSTLDRSITNVSDNMVLLLVA